MPDSSSLSSSLPKKDIISSPVGAGVAEAEDHYLSHYNFLKWIQETQTKLPNATPSIRREAFLADPLLKGTIYPYLKNVLLQGFTIQTKDNKLYSEAIEEITAYLDDLNLMKVFRDDFLDFFILVGHSYRRMDSDKAGNIVSLEKIDPASVIMYTDPWDSSIVAYHQKALIKSSWSQSSVTQRVDSWFVPYENKIRDINSTYIQDRKEGNDETVKALFETYQEKYGITDIVNLRIAAAERVIGMHNSDRIDTCSTVNEYGRAEGIDNPAPIDSVLLAIWLKRLLLVNAPNLIYIVISPFLHLVSGILKETKDFTGNPVIISSNPQKPNPLIQSSNPAGYAAELENFEGWLKALNDAAKNLLKSMKEGGVFVSGPDMEIKTVESSRNVSFQLIKGLIDQLNEEIGQGLGFPMALISAHGAELATSRTILQFFNTAHAGERLEYETAADMLIEKMFADKKWIGKTTDENKKEITVPYSFSDVAAHFVLDIADLKDVLQEAQAIQVKADTLTKIKAVGAGKEDLQALGQEYGFGLLGLDDHQAITKEEAVQVNAILKSVLGEIMQGYNSTSPTAPSNFNEKELENKLKDAYQAARGAVDELFDEN